MAASSPVLNRLTVRGFKSLADATVELPRFAVLFGPNATGKSNLLDAIQVLSRIARTTTLSDAFGGPFPARGRAVEAFTFGKGGLQALLQQPSAEFTLEADISAQETRYRYRVRPSMNFRSGEISVTDEYLARLWPSGKTQGTPAIEANDDVLHAGLDDVRREFAGWRTYHLEPRRLMRQDEALMDVTDIGVHGQTLATFLYKLRATQPRRFEAIARVLRTIVPSVETLDVGLDERRGILDLEVRQGGTSYSSRVLSEGTLRLLALCAIAVNPWAGSLVAVDEPENSVHPRRIDSVARLLVSLSERERRQVVVATHSPLFVDAVLRIRNEDAVEGVGLFNVRLVEGQTVIQPFDADGPLFQDEEIVSALASSGEDAVFQGLVLRGFLDE